MANLEPGSWEQSLTTAENWLTLPDSTKVFNQLVLLLFGGWTSLGHRIRVFFCRVGRSSLAAWSSRCQ